MRRADEARLVRVMADEPDLGRMPSAFSNPVPACRELADAALAKAAADDDRCVSLQLATLRSA